MQRQRPFYGVTQNQMEIQQENPGGDHRGSQDRTINMGLLLAGLLQHNRRILSVPARFGGGRLTERIPAIQPSGGNGSGSTGSNFGRGGDSGGRVQ